MTLVNARAAFEKAVTDAVVAADNTVSVVYDNVTFVTPGKAKKYVVMNLNFTQATLQNQGASTDYYSGVVQCNVYVPKLKGTSVLSAISESVIDGLTSVNASNYSVIKIPFKPRKFFMTVNIQVLLKSRPAGKPSIDNFEIKEIKIIK